MSNSFSSSEKYICRIDLASALENEKRRFKVFAGFDGFVDEIIHVVKQRSGAEEFVRMKYMEEFGGFINAAAGLSANIEFLPVRKKMGGNGPIFANAMGMLGAFVDYVGAVGEENIHSVFDNVADSVTMTGLCEPAATQAIEFLDGKLICSELENLKQVNWETVSSKIGADNLVRKIREADLSGLLNWSLVIHCNDLWEGILNELSGRMEQKKEKLLFIDLADPKKRSAEDITKALSLVNRFTDYFRVVLGLNFSEACTIAEVLGVKDQKDTASELAEAIYEKMDVDTVLVHPTDHAAAADSEGSYMVTGPFCENPVLTTGAGDNFNAGYALGMLMGRSVPECLILATAVSGFYVRYARSPKEEELAAFLRDWEKEDSAEMKS